MTGLFTKLNKRLPARTSSSDSIPIARVIHNQPIPTNASADDLDKIVTQPTHPIEAIERPTETTPWDTFNELLSDPLVTDIFFTQPDQISYRKSGMSMCWMNSISDEQYHDLCEAAESQLHARCKDSNNYLIGMISAPLLARLSISHPKICNSQWPSLHLRIPRVSQTFYDLIKSKMLPAPFASWLTEVLASRCVHIAICGAPHSGKSTLCGTLTHASPSEERIIALERFAEIFPPSRKLERICFTCPTGEPAFGPISNWETAFEAAIKNVPDRIAITGLPPHASATQQAGITRALQCTVPLVLEFDSTSADSFARHLAALGSTLPIILLETQLHERRPVIRQALEIADNAVIEIMAFHSSIEDKRKWVRTKELSLVRQLISERGHELKTGANLLDGFPEGE